MTENIQPTTNAIEEVLKAKFDTDERVIASIVDEIEKTFPDANQASLISRIAVKLYHATTDIDELNVQGMYTATVLDALTKILVDDLKIIDVKVLQQAVQEAHDIAKESIEEANRIAFRYDEGQQTTSGLVASEVNTI